MCCILTASKQADFNRIFKKSNLRESIKSTVKLFSAGTASLMNLEMQKQKFSQSAEGKRLSKFSLGGKLSLRLNQVSQ